jgi:UDP-2-acetamido-3-amino-2,3-dideoxy-glucuronate N-acetyltransferase
LMSGRRNVAVIGAGYWGKNLVRNFDGLGALAAVCEADAAQLELVGGQYPQARLFDCFEDVLADPDIPAVAIATPAEMHFQMAAAALAADKDVFVEKPLCLRTREAERLIAVARERGRILMVGHLLEYHPAVLKLKEMIVRGDLGRIHYIYSNRLNLGKVRREENILWSFAPHDIAVILRLIGDMPFEVTATGGTYLQPNIADVTVTSLLFDNGVRAHIFVSWLHPYKEQRLVVVGSKRMAVFDDVARENKLVVYDQQVEWVNGNPVPRKRDAVPVEFESVEPLSAECLHFLDCMETRETPRTDGASGLRVLQVLQSAQRSLMTHGQPVALEAGAMEVRVL